MPIVTKYQWKALEDGVLRKVCHNVSPWYKVYLDELFEYKEQAYPALENFLLEKYQAKEFLPWMVNCHSFVLIEVAVFVCGGNYDK